jgi:hypothetical protein
VYLEQGEQNKMCAFVNRNRNKFINQIRAPGGHIQLTNMIDTQQYIKINIHGVKFCVSPLSFHIEILLYQYGKSALDTSRTLFLLASTQGASST